VLPEHADHSSDMVAFGPAAAAAAAAARARRASAAAEEFEAAVDEDADHDHDYTAAADGMPRQQANTSSSNCSSWEPAELHGANDGSSSSSGGSGSSSFPEPLHVLCERVVAQQMVEPRTALAILEYADVAGEIDRGF
jgi:hypothetical protein